MKKKSVVFRGLAAVMAFVTCLTVSVTNLALKYNGTINMLMGISTRVVVNTEGEEIGTEAYYYENDYGYNADALVDVYADAAASNVETAEEGIVLLKNENDALPIKEGSRMTIFGNASVNGPMFSAKSASYMTATSFLSAMEEEFGADNINEVLCTDVYTGMQSTSNTAVAEAEIANVTAHEDTWKNDYNDVAVVVLTRDGGEGNDVSMYSATDTYEDGTPRHFLDLSRNEEDLIAYLAKQKEAGVFDRIVVIIGSDFSMELNFLEEYDIDAAVVTGELGSYGCTGLAKVLSGEVNPSGHLTDTYASNSLSAPATLYTAENYYTWTNSDKVNAAVTTANDSNGINIDNYLLYMEGIYVGYKYYETRYEDVVMGNGNADSTVGSTSGNSWNYQDEMCYPFGYGLSYTTFEQTLDSVSYDESLDSYTVTVTVKNTGDVAGKDVIEVYAQTPYGDYEKSNLVEKASVELVAYDKTDVLDAGESQTMYISVPAYFLASYDTNGAGTYIMSAGDYYFAIGADVHEAMNNILASKGYTTADSMTADGDASKTYTWTEAELDTETYSTSIYTDAEVTNQFEATDINSFGYDLTYLSRNDWEGTYPEAHQLEATQEIIDGLNANYDYETPADASSVSDFTQGADNGLKLTDMVDIDLDDELWDDFVDQLTIQEMGDLMADNTASTTISEYEIIGRNCIDDGSNAGGDFTFISEPTTSRTWNTDMATDRGYYEGLIAYLEGYDEIWYGGGNMHRTPFGGRISQYYSEDSTVAYWQGYYEAEACQGVGTAYCIKHLALNENETVRQGLNVFANEQSVREIYLRAFEGAFAGGALSVMTTTSRMGTEGGKSYDELLTNVLRGEWGFKGHVTSDGYVDIGFYNNPKEELVAGYDFSCLDSSGWNGSQIVKYIEENDDGYLLSCLRSAAKHNLYVMAHSARMNTYASGGTVITVVPAWETALTAVNLVVILGFAVFAVLAIATSGKKKASERKEA